MGVAVKFKTIINSKYVVIATTRIRTPFLHPSTAFLIFVYFCPFYGTDVNKHDYNMCMSQIIRVFIIIMLSGTPSTAALVFVLITGGFLFVMLFDITSVVGCTVGS